MQLYVSGLVIWFLGFFIAGICLVNQPARVALVLAIVPALTVVLTALVWLSIVKGPKNRVRRSYAYR